MFEKLALIGIGLIGSSIARATRLKGLAKTIAISTRKQETLDEARLAATERLRSDGRVVRCLSFLKDGGLAAVVYPPAPPETKPDKRRRGRNGGR